MKLKVLFVLVALGIVFTARVCAQEEIEITTYYPAPYGSYKELRVKDNVAIGPTYYTAGPANSSARLVVEDRVGIGTDNPDRKLHIKQSVSSSSDGLRIENSAGSRNMRLWVGTGGAVVNSYSGANLHFRTDDTDRMFISCTNGRVGIGTTGPLYKLHLYGTSNNAADVYSQTDAARVVKHWFVNGNRKWSVGQVGTTGSPPYSFRITDETAGVARISIDTLGKVGIGINEPVTTLHVNGQSLWLTGGDGGGFPVTAGGGLRMYYSGGKGHIWAYKYGSGGGVKDLILQTAGGNVGIGTTTPNAPLHVYINDPNAEVVAGHFEAIGKNAAGDETIGVKAFGSRFGVYAEAGGATGTGVLAYGSSGGVGVHGDSYTGKAIYGSSNGTGGWAGYFSGNKVYSQGGFKAGSFPEYCINKKGACTYKDIAEDFLVDETCETADVVVIDSNNDYRLIKSSKPYDSTVAGVISLEPAFHISIQEEEKDKLKLSAGTQYMPLAIAGRVSCNATTENGPIKRGDLLVTSSKPGYAMKAVFLNFQEARNFQELKHILAENQKRQNAVIGKAIEPLEQGEGKVIALITLQ